MGTARAALFDYLFHACNKLMQALLFFHKQIKNLGHRGARITLISVLVIYGCLMNYFKT